LKILKKYFTQTSPQWGGGHYCPHPPLHGLRSRDTRPPIFSDNSHSSVQCSIAKNQLIFSGKSMEGDIKSHILSQLSQVLRIH